MKSFLSVVVALCLTQFVQAQYDPIYTPGQMMPGTYAPTQTVVANQTVMPSGMPGMPPIHMWHNGVREEWKTVHEIRPVRDYDYGCRDRENVCDPRYPASEGWYMNPATNNYQRNCVPSYPSYQQPCQSTVPMGGGWYTVGPQPGNGYCNPSYPTYQRQGWWR